MNDATPPHADWQQVKALFDEVLGLSPEQRREFLLAVTADDAVRREVVSLLAHAAGTLAPAVAASLDEGFGGAAAPALLEGQRLGSWVIAGTLGQGGMGEILRARRSDGAYEGQAAIKILKRGMDSEALLARFGQERRALARLNHPHIARLFDAGLTPDNRPYFVMELVEGQPIDRAVEGLEPEARVALFLQLADAVAYAHRLLLVHRDLKPSNVLVDRQGQVKLLDFGIAKALDPAECGADQTLTGERPFTPLYASPEQVRGEPVSTATDVYSLGVLLYVMLTGQRPYGRAATGTLDTARAVLEEEPARPSSMVSADPLWERTRRQLVGDLDNILLKALDKRIEARYPSVDALSADLTAFLEGHPVSARAASLGYVLGKFFRRNLAAAAAATLGALGLATGLAAALLQGRAVLALGAMGLSAGLVLALVQARRAQLARDAAAKARDEAQRHLSEMRRLANTMVFEVNDALEGGPTEGRRQLVRAAAQSLERQATIAQLTSADRIDLARALNRLGRIEGHEFTNNLGDLKGALAHYDRALKLLTPLQADSDAEWHGAMYAALEGRATTLRAQGQLAEALASVQRAAVHATRAAAIAPAELRWRQIECMAAIELSGHQYKSTRNTGLLHLDDALVSAECAMASSERLIALAGEDSQAWRVRAAALRMHASLLVIVGRLPQAVAAIRAASAALERAMAQPGGERVRLHDFVQGCIRFSIVMQAAGLDDEADAAAEQALAYAEVCLHTDPRNEWPQRQVFAALQVAQDLHLRRGQPQRSAAPYERAMASLTPGGAESRMPRWHWNHAWADALQIMCWVQGGEVDRAEKTAQRLDDWLRSGKLKLRENHGPTDAELDAHIRTAVAHVEAVRGRLTNAAAAAQVACERLDAMLAVRDARDVGERLVAVQNLVRLAQAPFGDSAAALALRAGIVARARRLDNALIERGILAPDQRAESRWLATQPEGS